MLPFQAFYVGSGDQTRSSCLYGKLFTKWTLLLCPYRFGFHFIYFRGGVHAMAYMWRSEDKGQGSILSFHCVGSTDRTQTSGLAARALTCWAISRIPGLDLLISEFCLGVKHTKMSSDSCRLGHSCQLHSHQLIKPSLVCFFLSLYKIKQRQHFSISSNRAINL